MADAAEGLHHVGDRDARRPFDVHDGREDAGHVDLDDQLSHGGVGVMSKREGSVASQTLSASLILRCRSRAIRIPPSPLAMTVRSSKESRGLKYVRLTRGCSH